MLSETYRKLVSYQCANPDCNYGLDAESHHIVPKRFGGKDKRDNYVCLCKKCHDIKDLHTNHESWMLTLLTWKFWQESKIKSNNISYLYPLNVGDLNEPKKIKVNNISYLEPTPIPKTSDPKPSPIIEALRPPHKATKPFLIRLLSSLAYFRAIGINGDDLVHDEINNRWLIKGSALPKFFKL
jgi:hypothetical protein